MNGRMIRDMVEGLNATRVGILMKANFRITKLMVEASTDGLRVKCMMVNGATERKKAMVFGVGSSVTAT